MKGRDENGNYYIFHDVKKIFTIHAHTNSSTHSKRYNIHHRCGIEIEMERFDVS